MSLLKWVFVPKYYLWVASILATCEALWHTDQGYYIRSFSTLRYIYCWFLRFLSRPGSPANSGAFGVRMNRTDPNETNITTRDPAAANWRSRINLRPPPPQSLAPLHLPKGYRIESPVLNGSSPWTSISTLSSLLPLAVGTNCSQIMDEQPTRRPTQCISAGYTCLWACLWAITVSLRDLRPYLLDRKILGICYPRARDTGHMKKTNMSGSQRDTPKKCGTGRGMRTGFKFQARDTRNVRNCPLLFSCFCKFLSSPCTSFCFEF